MIKLTDVKKAYKSGNTVYPALNGISLTIEDGEYTAIVGTSGSGQKHAFEYYWWHGYSDRGAIFL